MYIITTTGDETVLRRIESVTVAGGSIRVDMREGVVGSQDENGALFQLPMLDLGSDAEQAVADWFVSPEGSFPDATIADDAEAGFVATKMDLRRRVKAKRNDVRDGGATITVSAGAKTFDTDLESRINVGGGVTMALILDLAFSVDWRLADNSLVTLNKADMLAVGLAFGNHVAACQERKNTLDAEIEAASDQAELDAIDVDAGWPS